MFDRTELTNDRFSVWKVFFLRDVTGFHNHAHKIKNIFISSRRQKYSEKTKGTVINRKSSEEKKIVLLSVAKTNNFK
jgi:hypothetical protein